MEKPKTKFKARQLIFFLRLFAVIDCLFANKFELYTYTDDGIRVNKTKFWKQEILDSINKK